jgi:hypothetical protein
MFPKLALTAKTVLACIRLCLSLALTSYEHCAQRGFLPFVYGCIFTGVANTTAMWFHKMKG